MSILNHRTVVLDPQFKDLEEFMLSIPALFTENKGVVIHKGRNELRRIEYKGVEYVVKAFHRPNIINRFVYGVFRPSKAKRSYHYANIYREIGVGTPTPVGYMNIRKGLLFDRSYYVTLTSTCPYRYEDLFTHDFPYAEEVLRAIGRTTAVLHEHGYAHKDYGRANILFQQLEDGSIKLEIVDLNRMAVGPIDMKAGCKNFERLPATPEMHRLMAEEYAKARGFDAQKCFELMQAYRSVQPGKIDGLY
ncbi:lipopolysaccharide kinase InaA family protein [uncultured Bacteroides sp.]|uniref:lipopolysaccharide kinase InaA family protein n=1 Tax=uncultured Bacteroides sp. TaxID=162156 RepID=UPI00261C4CF0|nr:lipopolysaccharide kinase InaA family protein [uncultured Bacteroides sp.]